MSGVDWGEAPEWATGFGRTIKSGQYLWIGASCYEYTAAYGGRKHDWASTPGMLTRHRSEVEVLGNRPEGWSGVGLPPVGTVCEHEFEGNGWYEGTVVAHHGGWVIFFIDEDRIQAYAGGFRKLVQP